MTINESISLVSRGVLAFAVAALLLSTGYALGVASIVHQDTGSICIEREFYCSDYSDMHHLCYKEECHLQDDMIITNDNYWVMANRTQIELNYSLDKLPDGATIDSVSVTWYDQYGSCTENKTSYSCIRKGTGG